MVSGLVMTLAQSAIGLYFYIINNDQVNPDATVSWIPLALFIMFMIGYSIGFASLPYVLMGELLPSKYRNTLGGIVSSFNLVNNFMVLKLFTTLGTYLGYHGVFWIYAINSLLASIFVYFVLPETKGKTLSEIEQLF
jgi:facilitated trehalose transporter